MCTKNCRNWAVSWPPTIFQITTTKFKFTAQFSARVSHSRIDSFKQNKMNLIPSNLLFVSFFLDVGNNNNNNNNTINKHWIPKQTRTSNRTHIIWSIWLNSFHIISFRPILRIQAASTEGNNNNKRKLFFFFKTIENYYVSRNLNAVIHGIYLVKTLLASCNEMAPNDFV